MINSKQQPGRRPSARGLLAALAIALAGCAGGEDIGAIAGEMVVADSASGGGASAGSQQRRALSELRFEQTDSSARIRRSQPTTGTTTPASGQATRSGIGVNPAAFAYWSRDIPTIDQFKRNSGWTPRCDPWETPSCKDFAEGTSYSDTKERNALDLDENGWVRSLPSATDPNLKYRYVATLLFHEDGAVRVPGKYVVLYDGEGKLTYRLAGTKVEAESRPGRDVVQVDGNVTYGLLVELRATNPMNHLRNIRVIPPGGVCSSAPQDYVQDASACPQGGYTSLEQLASTQVFHPAFLKDMQGLRTIRFLNWLKASDNALVKWEQRPKPSDMAWSTAFGVPYEVAFGLARSTDADPWITLPPYIDDDHVRQFAKLAKAELGNRRTLVLEYGNEPWNYSYPWGVTGAWFEEQGRKKWPNASAGLSLRMNWYAFRSAQVCQMVKAEFGAEASRIKCVLNTQAANPGVSEAVLACPLAAAELGSSCAQRVDALAIAPYFGGYIGSATYAPTTAAWADQPAWGLDMLFRELLGEDASGKAVVPPLYAAHGSAGKSPAGGALAQAREWMKSQKQIADRYGLPMFAYEGGQHMIASNGDASLIALLAAANRDARMGAVYARYMQDWVASGGQVLTLYSHATAYDRWGSFGLKEGQFTNDMPKWKAVRGFAESQACWWSNCGQ